jgi:serine/threonine-protein kinase
VVVSDGPSRLFRITLALALVTAGTCAVVPASAQEKELTPDQKAQAQVLFDKGKALFDQGKCQDAVPLLAESNRIDPGIGTLLHLSDCQAQLGLTASAWAGFVEAAALARAKGQADREKIARQQADALEPKLSRLRVVVAEQNKDIGLVLKRNGAVVSALSFGDWLPVDPGPQKLEAEAPGYKPWSETVEVPQGPTRTEASVPALEKAPEPVKPPPPKPESGLTLGDIMKISGIAIGGTGVLSICFGAGFGIHAIVSYNEALDTCEGGDTEECTPRGVRLQRNASTSALVSTVTFSVGGSLLAGGALMFFLAPEDEPPPVGFMIDPRGGAFLTFGGAL